MGKLLPERGMEIALERIEECKKTKSTFLNLRELGLTKIPEEIRELDHVTILDLSDNLITRIEGLEKLTKLTGLYLSNNQISRIEGLEKLAALTELKLWDNKISRIEGLENLTGLTVLDLSGNQISDIEGLENLTKLTHIDLSQNQISDIKGLDELVQLPCLEYVDLKFNPLPEGVPFQQDNCLRALKEYLRSIEEAEDQDFTLDVKLIVLGNTTAGKTSLMDYLRTGKYKKDCGSTHGIKHTIWEPGDDLHVHVWDFGGQEYYHATHRLFMQKRAVYLLVWEPETNLEDTVEIEICIDGEKEKRMLEIFPLVYWLQLIRSYSPDSPIMIVQTKTDRNKDIWLEKVQRDFGDVEIFDISVENAYDDDDISKAEVVVLKKKLLRRLNAYVPTLPKGKSTVLLRKALNGESKSQSLDFDQFRAMCKAIDNKTKSKNDIDPVGVAEILRNSGDVLYYPEIQKIGNKIFLHPTRIADNIYKILDRHVMKNGGRFDRQHVLDKYPEKRGQNREEEVDSLLAIMKEFCMIFSEPDEEVGFIAPQYLPPISEYQRGKAEEREGSPLRFTVRWSEFLAKGDFARFISEFGRYAEKSQFWKNGIIFTGNDRKYGKSDIYASCNYREQSIEIYASDNAPNLFLEILDTLAEITGFQHGYRSRSKNRMTISLDGHGFVDYERLCEKRRDGKMHILGENRKIISMEQFYRFFEWEDNMKGLKVFISYAHKDMSYFEVFLDRLKTATSNPNGVYWDIWHDDKLILGKDWDKSIRDEMKKCKVAILLISNAFMASKYISEVELEQLILEESERDLVIIPVKFEPCNYKFSKLPERQYFEPSIQLYGQTTPHKVTFAEIVQFTSDKEVVPSAAIPKYINELVSRIGIAIQEQSL